MRSLGNRECARKTTASGLLFKPRSDCFRPFLVWTHRVRLVRAQVLRPDRREDKVLRRNRISRKPTQHGQLPRMCHGIGKRSLQHLFRSDSPKLGSRLKMPSQILEHPVKVPDCLVETIVPRRLVHPADQKGARISQYAIHMLDQFARRTHQGLCPEIREVRRGAPNRLLQSVSERCQKVPQHCPFLVHVVLPGEYYHHNPNQVRRQSGPPHGRFDFNSDCLNNRSR